jgi:hypothetical protein
MVVVYSMICGGIRAVVANCRTLRMKAAASVLQPADEPRRFVRCAALKLTRDKRQGSVKGP